MKNITWLFIPRMSDQREARVKHYVAGSALMVFPWDKPRKQPAEQVGTQALSTHVLSI